MNVEARLRQLGLELPQLIQLPPEVRAPFSWVRLYGDRAYVSGQAPLNPDGTLAAPFGRVGAELSAEQGYHAARLATLSILATLKQALGDLDRIAAWLMVSGMINVAPGFIRTTNIINGCSDLLLEVFGPGVGQHARSAIGMAQLPNDSPVIIAAEIAVHAG